ncbi:uncharacterized protein LOC117980458, partial [Pan paniscus]|uniref:uncharacterized protein LOC117980458 n=1 Tax=Pan paniscus TaxID=9597 RepID=UPI0024365956
GNGFSGAKVRSGECPPLFVAKPSHAVPFLRHPPHPGPAGLRGCHRLGNRPPVGGESRDARKCSGACRSAARSASVSGSVTEVAPVRPFLPRPYVSANPTLRGGRLRQDPESETGAGDLPDPVTTLVLLRNRLPLAGSADYNPEAKPNLSAFVYKVLMEQSCEPAVCGLRLPLDTAAELIPTQTSGPTEGGTFPPSSPLSTSRRSR